jgi:phosphate/sulfate permease
LQENNVGWWQIVLIILGSIIIGIVAGYLLSYLALTLLRKRAFSKNREEEEAKKVRGAEEQTKKEVEVAEVIADRIREEAPVVGEPQQPIMPELVSEIKNNLKVASEPWAGKLIPFQTNEWDTISSKLHVLPINLQELLTETYTDIRLANSIVWLSTDLDRRSNNLDENYMKLCATIAERLSKIKALLEQPEV